MLDRIKSALRNISASFTQAADETQEDSIQFAVAMLLVELMHADHQLDAREKTMVVELLQQQFSLDRQAAITLFDEADARTTDAVSLHQYTSIVNATFSYQQKQTLMVNLWRVVFADGKVDKYEEHLVRRLADLIHVSHTDFIKAKHQAEANPLG